MERIKHIQKWVGEVLERKWYYSILVVALYLILAASEVPSLRVGK